jgi:hypothetical protein
MATSTLPNGPLKTCAAEIAQHHGPEQHVVERDTGEQDDVAAGPGDGEGRHARHAVEAVEPRSPMRHCGPGGLGHEGLEDQGDRQRDDADEHAPDLAIEHEIAEHEGGEGAQSTESARASNVKP